MKVLVYPGLGKKQLDESAEARLARGQRLNGSREKIIHSNKWGEDPYIKCTKAQPILIL